MLNCRDQKEQIRAKLDYGCLIVNFARSPNSLSVGITLSDLTISLILKSFGVGENDLILHKSEQALASLWRTGTFSLCRSLMVGLVWAEIVVESNLNNH